MKNYVQSLCAVIVAIVAILIFVNSLRGSPTPNAVRMPSQHFDITLLADEAASPGKTIKAVKDGRILGSYTCSAQDASVAWLYDNGATKLDQGLIDQSAMFAVGGAQAADESGRPFPFSHVQVGPVVRLVFPRGYAKQPASILFKVFDGRFDHEAKNETKIIKLTHFALPIRSISAPSPSEAKASESDAIAICETQPNGKLAHEIVDVQVVSSSYCPEGSEVPNATEYATDTDAVKVRVDRYKSVESITTLIYKDAQIADVNGVRTLRFPTTQDIGYVLDAKAWIQKLLPISNQRSSRSSATGDLLVRLDRKQHLETRFSPKASLASIFPPIAALGLNRIRFRIGDTGYGEDQTSRTKPNQSFTSTVPELKIGIRVTTPVKISSHILILPVHHIKAIPRKRKRTLIGIPAFVIPTSIDVFLPNKKGEKPRIGVGKP